MKGEAAGLSTIIVGVSAFFVVATIVAFVLYFFFLPNQKWLLAVGGVLLVMVVWTYLRSPVAYELNRNELTVQFRIGNKTFGPIAGCRPIEEPVSFAVRLWGNGGLFAVTGIYRNKVFGQFRAYVTNLESLVLVETREGKKIVISPANPGGWSCPAGSTVN